MNEDSLTEYKKNIENSLESEIIPRMEKVLQDMKQFSVGDYVHIYKYHNDKYEYTDCYRVNNKLTDIPIKHKVIYIDSAGFPHFTEVLKDGKLSESFYELYDYVNDFIYDSNLHELEVNKMFVLDPDFLDATILGQDYDPVAKLKELEKTEQEERTKELRAIKLMV